jgi:hypothetical protein
MSRFNAGDYVTINATGQAGVVQAPVGGPQSLDGDTSIPVLVDLGTVDKLVLGKVTISVPVSGLTDA